jgi:hypothetical protein
MKRENKNLADFQKNRSISAALPDSPFATIFSKEPQICMQHPFSFLLPKSPTASSKEEHTKPAWANIKGQLSKVKNASKPVACT